MRESLRKKTIALLAYLVVEGRPIARDTIATLLWPDAGQSGARGNLRTCIHNARAVLGDACFVMGCDAMELDRALVASDYTDLQELADRQPSETLRLLRENDGGLHALAAGEFLEGFTLPDCRGFDDWQFQFGEAARSTRMQVLRELVTHGLNSGYSRETVEHARTLVRIDPLEEESHRLAMRSLAAAGLWSQAEHQYHECVRILREELQSEPDDETRDLAERITRHDSDLLACTEPDGRAPWRSTPTTRSTLPVERDAFFGRERETASIGSLLTSGEERLITLTGPGGSGKTRLAIRLARDVEASFADGVVFVDLTVTENGSDLVPLVAAAIGLRDRSFDTPNDAESLAVRLDERSLLIVIDNFEHVMSSASVIAEVLLKCARVVMLVTSREPLHLRGERTVCLAPLGLPRADSPEAVLESPAARLFVARAEASGFTVEADPESIESLRIILNRLDGLPLAIELAVPLLRLYALPELAQRLERRVDLPDSARRDGPRRHQSIRTVFDWSYRLLTASERVLLAELSIFANGFDLEAAEGVCSRPTGDAADGLAPVLCSLIEKNLVRAERSERTRTFGMFEVMRQSAQEKRSVEHPQLEVEQRHASYYARRAIRLAARLHGSGQLDAQQELEAIAPNLSAALSYLLRAGCGEEGLDLTVALWAFWYRSGRFSVCANWIRSFLALLPSDHVHPGAYYALGTMTFFLGQWRAADRFLDICLAHCGETGDHTRRAIALAYQGIIARWLGDRDTGWNCQIRGESLARSLSNPEALLTTLILVYCTSGGVFPGDPPFDKLEEGIALAIQLHDNWSLAHLRNGLGDLNSVLGDYASARESYLASISLFEDFGDRFMIGWNYQGLGSAASRVGQLRDAARWNWQAYRVFDGLGDDLNSALLLAELARIVLEEPGSAPDAAVLAGAAFAVFGRIHQEEVCGSPEVVRALDVIERLNTTDAHAFEDGRRRSRSGIAEFVAKLDLV